MSVLERETAPSRPRRLRDASSPRTPEAVSVVVWAGRECGDAAATVASALALAETRIGATEVVVVHDCTRDATWRPLLELKEENPELHLIDFGAPYGEEISRLVGVRRASAELVCFAPPLADAATLSRVVENAVSRESAAALLEESMDGPVGRLLVQSFPPGKAVHLRDGPPARATRTVKRSHRRIAAAAAVLLTSVAAAGGLALTYGAGEPEGDADDAALSMTALPSIEAKSPATDASNLIASPAAPTPAPKPARETRIGRSDGDNPRQLAPPPISASVLATVASAGHGSTGANPPTTSSGPERTTPPVTSEPEGTPPPPPPRPAGDDAAVPPSTASPPETPPVVSSAVEPAPQPTAPDPASGTPEPTQPPELPPDTTPTDPGTTPAADAEPGGGPGNNGNGNAYGHTGENGNGNGNANEQAGGNGNGNGNGNR